MVQRVFSGSADAEDFDAGEGFYFGFYLWHIIQGLGFKWLSFKKFLILNTKTK